MRSDVRKLIAAAGAVMAAAALLTACSSEPSPRQLVKEAADEYFGGGLTQIYVTGTSKLCNDLEGGISAEQSLVGATPEAYVFYTTIAVPIMCPEYA